MTPYEKETLENIRRTAERGLAYAQVDYFPEWKRVSSDYIELFQHILDELGRINATNS